MSVIEKILKYSAIYSLSQYIFAPGSQFILNRKIKSLTARIPEKKIIIDIGCGPNSWLWQAGLDPIGLDISHRYSKTFLEKGTLAITGSATDIPLKDNSVEGIWCIGVLHHLDDQQAKHTIREMNRIVKEGGYLIILDAVLPKNQYTRPIASFIRKMDRGRFMRTHDQLMSLLQSSDIMNWNVKRYTYAATGLEMLECVLIHHTN